MWRASHAVDRRRFIGSPKKRVAFFVDASVWAWGIMLSSGQRCWRRRPASSPSIFSTRPPSVFPPLAGADRKKTDGDNLTVHSPRSNPGPQPASREHPTVLTGWTDWGRPLQFCDAGLGHAGRHRPSPPEAGFVSPCPPLPSHPGHRVTKSPSAGFCEAGPPHAPEIALLRRKTKRGVKAPPSYSIGPFHSGGPSAGASRKFLPRSPALSSYADTSPLRAPPCDCYLPVKPSARSGGQNSFAAAAFRAAIFPEEPP